VSNKILLCRSYYLYVIVAGFFFSFESFIINQPPCQPHNGIIYPIA